MEFKEIVAIVRGSVLETVEKRLRDMGVKGISVSPIKGYGEYDNIYKTDRMVSKYPPVKPGALWVNRSKRLAQTLGRLKAAGYLSRFN
jgi:nitrogen regulatory protein PII